jgi:alpha-L-fucosidase
MITTAKARWGLLGVLLAATLAGQAVMPAQTSPPAVRQKPFTAELESLAAYQCPEWFRDAKFGIWAHWGPQSVPMEGDWYARRMYLQEDRDYQHHLDNYGHPSVAGWKDIIPLWKAEKWDPERLMTLYKQAGARYFVSMGVHHDNFDLWNSTYHPWNAVRMGPRRDVVGDWQAAARKQGLRFGVSEHLGASFTWFQASHGSDAVGPLAGKPYDGADPKWQELYHQPAAPGDTAWYSTDPRWHQEWSARITDLVDHYQPDLLYTDGALPFGETGRRLLAHFYNQNQARHGGNLEAVYTLKDWRARPGHGDYVEGIGVQDVERGGLAAIKPLPWQTDTSIGDWFYNRNWKAKDTGGMYRSAEWVIRTLVDVVSKNGNMLLNVVQRPDGSLDPEVERLLAEVGAWMKVNGEAIYATRPWGVFGEGAARTDAGHFKEDFGFSAADIRFTQSKDGRTVYAIALGWPAGGAITIRSLASPASGGANRIERVELLGLGGPRVFVQTAEGLRVTLPGKPLSTIACAMRIVGRDLRPAVTPEPE